MLLLRDLATTSRKWVSNHSRAGRATCARCVSGWAKAGAMKAANAFRPHVAPRIIGSLFVMLGGPHDSCLLRVG